MDDPRNIPIETVIGMLRQHGLRLRSQGANLAISGPDGALTPALRSLLAARKAELLAFLDEAGRSQAAPGAIGRCAPDGDTAPASFAQARLWFLDQRGDAGGSYVVPLGMRLRGRLDAIALEAAITGLVERHEPLRTVFAERDGVLLQQVLPAVTMPPVIIDLTASLDPEAALRNEADAEASRPFDLRHDRALRTRLLRLGQDDHVLLLSFHHIAFDGWSAEIALRELAALYNAARAGTDAALPALALRYRDYAVWQRQHIAGGELARPLAYWVRQLESARPLLLPADHPRATERPPASAARRLRCALPGLAETCRALDATPFMVLLAGFATLLHRLTGETDIVLGSPIANRTRAESQGLVGFLVNALALRLDVSGRPDFATLVGRTRQVCLDGFAHQDLPFERVVEALRPTRLAGQATLFGIVFALLPATGTTPPALDGLDASALPEMPPATRFELELHLRPVDDGVEMLATYDATLFDAKTIEALLARFATLMQVLLADPRQRLDQPDLLLPGEAARLANWESGRLVPRHHDTLVAQVAASVARHAEAPAVDDGRVRLDYASLWREAGTVAVALAERGFGRGQVIGWQFDGSAAMLGALIGILRAGCGWVPIDPALPAARRHALLRQAGACLLLGNDPSAPLPGLEQMPVTSPAAGLPDITGNDLAYVIFTSGSTGEPKGVEISHRGAANLAQAQALFFGLAPGARVLQFASPGFDASVSEIFATLQAGAALHLAPRDALMPGPELLATLRDRRITCATLPPVVLRAMPADRLPDLAVVVSAGEACTAEMVAAWAPGRRFVNAYGPTEAGVCGAEGMVAAGDAPTVGRPLDNMRVRLLDHACRRLPAGAIGELRIGGPGVARGYRGRPDLTAECFRPDPFSENGERLYHTGDAARWNADGQLVMLGRLDNQLKLRGIRVEPAEVEAVLRAIPGIADAAVVPRTDETGTATLAAYLVAAAPEMEFWPSIAEFFVYDALLYHALSSDRLREAAYKAAIANTVAGRVVLDVGTGGEAIQARLCVEAGARHVYAVELLARSAAQARDTVRRLGLADRITILEGDARIVPLPGTPDICVSEIVGSLGGSEGAAAILDSVRQRFPGIAMLPQRSLTLVAPVELPASVLDDPRFMPVAAHYVNEVFAQAGKRFDLRLCMRGVGAERLLSTPGVFEDLRFETPDAGSGRHDSRLTIARDGVMAGLLAWLTLDLDGTQRIDTLAAEHSWLPVLLPLPEAPLAVQADDVLELSCRWQASANGLNPDYTMDGRLCRGDALVAHFTIDSPHVAEGCGRSWLHHRLFGTTTLPETLPRPMPEMIRAALAARLPDVMVPATLEYLPALPRTPAGKLDRRALAARGDASQALRQALTSVPWVRAVAIRPDVPPHAFVVPDLALLNDAAEDDLAVIQLADWHAVHAGLHAEAAAEADLFHGWVGALTGAPIPSVQMQAWRDETVTRLAALAPRRLLEIGAGTGMILRALASRVETYVATDSSAPALELLAAWLRDKALPVRLLCRDAADLSDIGGPFDLIVLNSVVQYFPSLAYLKRVIDGAATLLAPGGTLFLGDIRHAGLAGAFAARGGRRLQDETELLIDPAWFATCGPASVAVLLKQGQAGCELTDWRYDVVLRRDPAPARPVLRALDWSADFIPDGAKPILLRGLPNARLQTGIDPDAVRARAHAHGWHMQAGYAAHDPMRFDALLTPSGTVSDPTWLDMPQAGPDIASDPLHRRRLDIARTLLADRLAQLGIEAALHIVESLPDMSAGRIGDPLEQAMAALWSELLGREVEAGNPDFFAQGGHSLLAVRLMTRVQERFGVTLAVKTLFEAPRLADFTGRVRALQAAPPEAAADAVDPDYWPLSPAQQRLWFLERLLPGGGAYAMPLALRLRGPVDPAALAEAVQRVLERHPALRMRVVDDARGPHGQVVPTPDVMLSPQAAGIADIEQFAFGAFSLDGPLWRAALFRLDETAHAFVLVFHHIVADGISMGIVLRDLALALRGETLPAPRQDYASLVHAQRLRLQGPEAAASLGRRCERLARPEPLDLPLDHARPALQDMAGASLPFAIPAPVGRRLRALAAAEATTLFSVLLTGFAVLLHRLCAQDDIIVGTPIAGRPSDAEDVVGLFVNTVAVRADCAGDPAFQVLLAAVTQDLREGIAANVPFEQLVQALRPERDLSRSPLVQAILVFQPPIEAIPLAGLDASAWPLRNIATRFDLEISLWEDTDALRGTVTYATALFDAATIQAVADAWPVLLEAIAAAPETRIRHLALAAAIEPTRIACATAPAADEAATLHGRFIAQARATPEARAIGVATGRPDVIAWTSYGDLLASAQAVAARLQAMGVRRGDRVGLVVGRDAEGIAALVGTLMTGATYVPVDPETPPLRTMALLADTRLVLASAAAAARLTAMRPPVVTLGATTPDLSDLVPNGAGAADIAYLIHTSGSTGAPKPVAIAHGQLLALFASAAEADPAGFTGADVWSCLHSLAFDFSVWEIWGALLHGGCLLLASDEVRRAPAEVLDMLQAGGVTILNQTPSAFAQLDAADAMAGTPALALRRVMFGGEALDPASLAGWITRRGDSTPRLANMYGITETTVHVTHRRIRDADTRMGRHSSPIGIPLPGVSLHVLGTDGQPVPAGFPGELHVGGWGISQGYAGRPALTADRFRPDAFSGQAGSRLYRSGDRGRIGRDGAIVHLGRLDAQVKLRGFRIEPGEIRACLLGDPAVGDAAVLMRGGRLIGWVVGHAVLPDPEAILMRLRDLLPAYMVPSRLVLLDRLPLTIQGKLDHRALPEPELAPAIFAVPFMNDLEQQIGAAFAEVLGTAIGATDNLFDAGGHSLLVPRMAEQASERTGRTIAVIELFRFPTVRLLAGHLAGKPDPGRNGDGELQRRRGLDRLQKGRLQKTRRAKAPA